MPATTARLGAHSALPPLTEQPAPRPWEICQGDSASKFYDLLSQIAAEHKRELDDCRHESAKHAVENTRLRAELVARVADTQEVTEAEDNCLNTETLNGDSNRLRGAGSDFTVEMVAALAQPSAPTPALEDNHANGRLPEAVFFELKGEWTKLPSNVTTWGQGLDRHMAKDLSHGLQASPTDLSLQASQGPLFAKARDHFLINPSGPAKMVWDFLGLLLISYDFVTIPLQAFDLQKTGFTVAMGWITLIFWTLDMIQGFFTGYYEDGELIMVKKKIVWHYMRTWFVLDLIVVVPEWVMTALGNTSISGLGRVFRAARAVRVLRLLRLAKVQKIMTLMYDLLDSEYSFIVVSLIKLLGFILLLNHVIACLWYWIGKTTRDRGETNWVQHAGYTPVDGGTFVWRYTTSLHWSLTQFTPAGMDVSARNVSERIFSVAVLFFALVAFSSVIGSVSASMTALRNIKGGETKQFWMLRRYLRQKNISRHLSGRVQKYLEHQCHLKMNAVNEKNITILNALSDQLRLELSCELYSPNILEHPFFSYLNEEMRVMMYRICYTSLRTINLASDDVQFAPHDEAKHMLFIAKGVFEYKQVDGTVLDPPLKNKAWISEAVLWTDWRHRGQLTACVPSEVVACEPRPFTEVMKLHPRSWYFAKAYGERFVEFVNGVPNAALTDVLFSDTFFQKTIASSDKYMFATDLNPGRRPSLDKSHSRPSLRGTKTAWSASEAA